MFIVIEGLDGAGKSTQIQKIKEYYNARGIETEYLHFPRYDAPIYGRLISEYLRGEMGSLEEVDPYMVAMLYAQDQRDGGKIIRKWLEEGKAVIVDRYAYSNISYQCAKVDDPQKKQELHRWIEELEFGHFNIPRPDLNIFLDVPFAFTRKSLESSREGADRDYLNGAADIHEKSLELQAKVREVYISTSRVDPTLRVVDCSKDGRMDSPEGIFEKIKELL